jgi:hypothetical protein
VVIVQEDDPPPEKRPRTTADTVVVDGFPFTSAGSNEALNEALPRVRVREVAGRPRDGPEKQSA